MIKWPEDLELEDSDSLEIQDGVSGMTITNNGWTSYEWTANYKRIMVIRGEEDSLEEAKIRSEEVRQNLLKEATNLEEVQKKIDRLKTLDNGDKKHE